MKITADTNVLVRALTGDEPHQASLAQKALDSAELVALPVPALCELVWVLSRGYGFHVHEITDAIRRLINSANVAVDRPVVEAGLTILDAGGDFADGAIAHEGRWLGASMFVSFDRKAVNLVRAAGQEARLLA